MANAVASATVVAVVVASVVIVVVASTVAIIGRTVAVVGVGKSAIRLEGAHLSAIVVITSRRPSGVAIVIAISVAVTLNV